VRFRATTFGLVILGLSSAAASSLGQNADRPASGAGSARLSTAQRITYPADRLATLVLPNGQKHVILSMLNIHSQMQFGDYVWNDSGIAAGQTWVRVDLARQTLSVFRAGHEIGTTVILFGADGKPTPTGVFPVLAKAVTHRSTLYDAEMPFMLRLTKDGVAIHASNVHKGAATHGCIGVPPGFARMLYAQMQIGDQVAIIAS
jgi:hypothetical protein